MTFTQNNPKRIPEGAKSPKSNPKSSQKGTSLSQKGTKMNPKGGKGAQKVSPKSTKIPQKIATSKKVEKGGSNATSFGVIFGLFLVKNASKNQCEKLCRKTCQKTWKLSKKQGTISPQKIEILKFLLQRRILQNIVFTREKQCLLKISCFESVHTFEKRPRKK